MSSNSSSSPEARVFVSVSAADAEMLQDWAMCSPSMQAALRKLIAVSHNASRGGGERRCGDLSTLVVPTATSDVASDLRAVQ